MNVIGVRDYCFNGKDLFAIDDFDIWFYNGFRKGSAMNWTKAAWYFYQWLCVPGHREYGSVHEALECWLQNGGVYLLKGDYQQFVLMVRLIYVNLRAVREVDGYRMKFNLVVRSTREQGAYAFDINDAKDLERQATNHEFSASFLRYFTDYQTILMQRG